MISVLRLLIAAGGVMLAVLASFGPIVAFFALSTTSYSFMKLLNVLVFAIAGFLSLAFLLRTLDRLTLAQEMSEWMKTFPTNPPELTGHAEPPPAAPPPPGLPYASVPAPATGEPKATPGALERAHKGPTGPQVITVFRIWVLVFGLVGAQMSWVLRPFVGDPDADFTFLRPRSSNFFEAVFHTLSKLLS